MTDDCAEYVQLYAASDRCQLAKLHGEHQARALVWEYADGQFALDRCYPNNGVGSRILRRWALDRGWLVRDGDGAPSSNVAFVDGDGAQHWLTIDTRVSTDDIEYYPYVDTLRHGHIDSHGDVILSCKPSANSTVLNSTNGEGLSLRCCCECGDRLSRDDVITDDNGDDWCESCHDDKHTTCESCDETVHNDNINEVELYINGQHHETQHLCDCCCRSASITS